MSGAQTWLDVMPAIPLERSVPVIDIEGILLDECIRGVTLAPDVVRFRSEEVAFDEEETEYGLRVDLDDPQGFAYALTIVDRPIRWVSNWLNGKTTDADRLALAQALAEVTP